MSVSLFGLFSAPLTIWAQTLRMRIIPPGLRGRTFALLRMLMQSGNPIGGALAGLALPLLGLSATISVGPCGAPAVPAWLARAYALRTDSGCGETAGETVQASIS